MPNNAKINLFGNLTKDPEARTVGSNSVVSMGVAVNTMRKNADNTYRTNFYDVSVWGKPGEYLMQRLQKGSQVWVTGDFAQDEFDGKDGNKHFVLRVDNADVRPIGKLKEVASATSNPAPQASNTDNEMPF